MLVREGGVELSVPEQPDDGVGTAVFFNPDMELNRDVTVAALRAYRDREPRAESYLDATAATGARGVRAAADGWTATLADVDADAVERCRANVERNGVDAAVVHRNANSLLHDRDRVIDVVDLDPFGSPVPFADAAFANARNLVCVTATDTAPLCGAHFASGVRRYDAVPRNTEYHAEVGLRVLLSALARTAARHDVGVTPLLSHVSDHYVRTYLELHRGATPADEALGELGHLAHCPECLWRRTAPGRLAEIPDACAHCGSEQVVGAGPLWLGPAHDREFVAATRAHLDAGMGTATRADRLLERVGGELHEPTHYDQHRLAKRWNVTAGPMDECLAALREAGHRASRTHFGGTTFKTDAGLAGVEAALRD